MYQNLTHKDVTARKEHRCDWCGKVIHKGEKYHYESFIFDDKFCDWHSHLACYNVVSAIWDYADPYDGMGSDEFRENCYEVCREFICPDCPRWNKEYEDCEDDCPYCIDKMDEFFKTHELYAVREGYDRVWKCRKKNNVETEE